jgi:hypothetical protein
MATHGVAQMGHRKAFFTILVAIVERIVVRDVLRSVRSDMRNRHLLRKCQQQRDRAVQNDTTHRLTI